jgi:hypothetical protein
MDTQKILSVDRKQLVHALHGQYEGISFKCIPKHIIFYMPHNIKGVQREE